MAKCILCCSKALPLQLEDMQKAGRKGKLAAQICHEIIEEISRVGLSGNYLQSKRTKNGEARLEKCIKYDLGNGYRLITIRCKDYLYIPFAGKHDKADLWLKHNRTENLLKSRSMYTYTEVNYVHKHCDSAQEEPPKREESDEYEEILMGKIDDTTLRHEFRGLVTQRSNQ